MWIAVSVPFIILGFRAGLFPGLVALAIAIGGVLLNNRAFREHDN
jgi:hypothetical protein